MPSFFFNEVTLFKRILYTTCILYVLCTAIAVLIEPYLTLSCEYNPLNSTTTSTTTRLTFPNPFYAHNPCQSKIRYLPLMGLTRRECEFGRNMVMSVLLGSIIGYERRSADRPAGIRTMSVVSLTSCLFTLNSTFVFMIGPMRWERIGVGDNNTLLLLWLWFYSCSFAQFMFYLHLLGFPFLVHIYHHHHHYMMTWLLHDTVRKLGSW